MKVGLFTVSSTLAGQLEIGRSVALRASSLLEKIKPDLKVPDLVTSAEAAGEVTKGLAGEISGAIGQV